MEITDYIVLFMAGLAMIISDLVVYILGYMPETFIGMIIMQVMIVIPITLFISMLLSEPSNEMPDKIDNPSNDDKHDYYRSIP